MVMTLFRILVTLLTGTPLNFQARLSGQAQNLNPKPKPGTVKRKPGSSGDAALALTAPCGRPGVGTGDLRLSLAAPWAADSLQGLGFRV